MEDKKVDLKWFTIFQYRQEEEYLSSMHEKGWKLSKIKLPGFYHFEKCEPGKFTYCLDYNKDGINNKTEYVQMFVDCGWEYLFDFAGYSYFRKEHGIGQEREEIFCDDSSRLDMMKRVFKGRLVPLIILFALVVLPQLFANTLGYGGGSIIQDILSVILLIEAILYLFIFSHTIYWFYQYEKNMQPQKRSVNYKYYGISVLMLLIVICIGMLFYFTKRSVYSVLDEADGFTIVAEQLNTCVEMEYDLKEGDIIAFTHDYDGGEIYISIGEADKDPVFFGNSYSEMEDFTLEIHEAGRYKIICSGRRAKGIIRFAVCSAPIF
ncbi:MAG: DUF2812 domain-containing protein [Acetatifactor sp.]|nr:DUF2812 domain-containing protein [Acetatifactor sp.]